jgi:hypothetical protein
MEVAILVPLGFFAMIAIIVVGPSYFRSRDRQRLIDTVKVAYERGQPVPPDLIEAMQAPQTPVRSTPERDFRTGVILVAVALAFVLTGGAIYGAEGDDEALWVMTGMGAFPGLIGLAFLAFWLNKRGSAVDTDPRA